MRTERRGRQHKLIGGGGGRGKSAAGTPTPPASALGPRPATPDVPPPELRATLAAYLVPGRMVFLDFILDARGLRLVGATGAEGRAKDLGPRRGFGFMHYEVLSADGRVLLAASVEDPLAVRLPGEVPAARIVLYRDRNPLVPGGTPDREPLGTFELRPPR